MNQTNCTLNLSLHPANTPLSELHGPGHRFPIWVQGCSIRCTDDCISPHLIDRRPRHLLQVGAVLEMLRKRARHAPESVEGVTFLGGEPTDQAGPLAALARAVREWDWTVMTYSGHTLQQLRKGDSTPIRDLLAATDILIDGPFVPSLQDPDLRWRGSSNQRIHLLTDRYRIDQIESLPAKKGVDVTLTPQGRLVVSGVEEKETVRRLEMAFRRRRLIE